MSGAPSRGPGRVPDERRLGVRWRPAIGTVANDVDPARPVPSLQDPGDLLVHGDHGRDPADETTFVGTQQRPCRRRQHGRGSGVDIQLVRVVDHREALVEVWRDGREARQIVHVPQVDRSGRVDHPPPPRAQGADVGADPADAAGACREPASSVGAEGIRPFL